MIHHHHNRTAVLARLTALALIAIALISAHIKKKGVLSMRELVAAFLGIDPFLGDISACQSRNSTGEISNINDGCTGELVSRAVVVRFIQK